MIDVAEQSSEGKLKLTFTERTQDELEWTSDFTGGSYDNKTWSYARNYKASGQDVSCDDNYIAALKQSCDSLTKK